MSATGPPMTGDKTAYLGWGTWLRLAVDAGKDSATVSVFVADGNENGPLSMFRHSGDLLMANAEAVVFLGLLRDAP